MKRNRHPMILPLVLLTILIVSCQRATGSDGIETAVIQELTATPTDAPMAARVNGAVILLSDFEAELQRYRTAVALVGEEVNDADAKSVVVDEMVRQTLLAQSAFQEGFILEDSDLQSRMDTLITEAGGAEAFNIWLAENSFTDESFRRALARDIAAVWMRNRILESVPKIADQVHARQILVRSENEAVAAQRRLQVGTDFTALAYEYDPLTGGELGWFPAGFLLQPDVEAAAFSLQPGEFSGIIPTSYGYHIVYVIERDENHPLSTEALMKKQREALADWLAGKRNQSQIEILVN